MQIKKQFASQGCRQAGRIAGHNPKKAWKSITYPSLPWGCSSKKQDGNWFRNWGVYGGAGTKHCWEGEKRAPGLELSLGPSSRGVPKTRRVPACLPEPALGASALQHLPLITFFMLIRSEGTLRGVLTTESVL